MKMIYTKKTIISIITAVIILPAIVIAQIESGFRPERLIEDRVFSDTSTFSGPEGIQKFLQGKGSILANTSSEFLLRLKEPQAVLLKQGLDDPEPNLSRLRTAAELIWDASKQSGLNPQVILVTLNKEQGLITGLRGVSSEKIQRALDFAMGFDCPDSSGCSSVFPGFYFQLFGNYDASGNRYLGAAKSLMKSFNTENGRGPMVDGKISRVGDTITIYNTTGGPNNAPESQLVTLTNKATAALYRFTPHVFNGNYNFWRYFKEWFKYPNGTIVQLSGDSNYYIIEDGERLLLPAFVAQGRGLDLSNPIVMSVSESADYPQTKILGPVDNTLVSIPGDMNTYIFINNERRLISNFVKNQRGLGSANLLAITSQEANLFPVGQALPPSDGTVVKGNIKPEIYLVDNGKLKLFTAFTFSQRKASKLVVKIEDTEVAGYPKEGFVMPLDGTLFKTENSSVVYLVDKGFKRPVSAVIFKNRKFSNSNVVKLKADEVATLVTSSAATPKEKTFFRAGNKGQIYIFKDGTKHLISSFVQKQRGITPDITVSTQEAGEWFDGIPLAPKDGSIIKGDKSATVYVVTKGQLQALTFQEFTKRKIKPKQVSVLTQAEIDGYAKSGELDK